MATGSISTAVGAARLDCGWVVRSAACTGWVVDGRNIMDEEDSGNEDDDNVDDKNDEGNLGKIIH